MRKSLIALVLSLFVNDAFASASTINPNVPAANSSLSSAVVRGNFTAAYNDINTIYSTALFSIPFPTLSTIGGVEALTPSTHNFLTGLNTSGVLLYSQPAFTDLTGIAAVTQGGTGVQLAQGTGNKVQLSTGTTTTSNCVKFDLNGNTVDSGAPCGTGSVTGVSFAGDGIVLVSTPTSPVTSSGTLTATLNQQAANSVLAGATSGGSATPTFRALVGADLPNPSATTLGGVQSVATATHNFLTGISTSGVPSKAQPACADLSNGSPSCSTDTTNASNISSGTLAAARGGAGTITGALKANGSGLVTQAACADLSNGAASCSTDTTNATNISSGILAQAVGGTGATTSGGALDNFLAPTTLGAQTINRTAAGTYQSIATRNIIGKCNVNDYYPNFASLSETQKGTALQNSIMECQKQAIDLGAATKGNLGLEAVFSFTMVNGGNFGTQLNTPIVFGRYIAPDQSVVLVRNGGNGSGTGSANWNGDTTTAGLTNWWEPFVIFPPTGQTSGSVRVIANANGNDRGAGYDYGKTWRMAQLTEQAQGTLFSGTESCTVLNGDTKSPAAGATFTCTHQTAGVCDAISFAPAASLPAATGRFTTPTGQYFWPPKLLRQQYQIAGSCGAANTMSGNNECWDGHDSLHPQVFDGFSYTGSTHGTTTIDGITSTAGLSTGMGIMGNGIPLNATITTVNANSIVISSAATATASNVSLTATNYYYKTTCGLSYTGNTHSNTTIDNLSTMTGFIVGQQISGAGIPAGTTITVVGGSSLTISQAATATGTAVALSTAYDHGLTVATKFWPDWCSGSAADSDTVACTSSTTYDGDFGNFSTSEGSMPAQVSVQQSGNLFNAAYGFTVAARMQPFELTSQYIQTGNSHYGYYNTGTDTVADQINDVDSSEQMTLLSGASKHINFFRLDTPQDSLNNDAHHANIDNTDNSDAAGVAFHNTGTNTDQNGAAFRFGLNSVSNSTHENSNFRLGWVTLSNDGASGQNLTAIDCNNTRDSTFLINVSNIGRNGIARTSQYNHLMNFGTNCDGDDLLMGSISNVSTNLFTGTNPGMGVMVWDGYAKSWAMSNGTYLIYSNGAPTNGTTGLNKAGIGSLALDYAGGALYLNTAPNTAPTWSKVNTDPQYSPVCTGFFNSGGGLNSAGQQVQFRATLYCPQGAISPRLVWPGFYMVTTTETSLTSPIPYNLSVVTNVPAPWQSTVAYTTGQSVLCNATQSVTGTSINNPICTAASGSTGSMPTPSNANWSAGAVIPPTAPVTCNGGQQCVQNALINASGSLQTQALLTTDPIPVTVPPGGYIQIVGWINQTGAQQVSTTGVQQFTTGNYFHQGTTITDNTATNANNAIISTSSTIMPAAVIGVPVTNTPSVCVIGDSISFGIAGGGLNTALISSGGSGYLASDEGKIVFLSDTGSSAFGTGLSGQVIITKVAAGAVTAIQPYNTGVYAGSANSQSFPSTSAGAQTTSGGGTTGSGLTVTATYNTSGVDFGDQYFARGYLQRMLSENGIPWTGSLNSGDTVAGWISRDYSRMAYIQRTGCRNVIIELGINDVRGATSAATIEADYVILKNQLLGLGTVKAVFLVTMPPDATSTDGYATLVNQTIESHDTVRTTVNDWKRNTATGLGFAGYFEAADLLESARNSGKFLVTGGGACGSGGAVTSNNVITCDGLHYLPYGVNLLTTGLGNPTSVLH